MPFALPIVLGPNAMLTLGFVLEPAAYHLIDRGGVELAVEDSDVPRSTPKIELSLEFPGGTDRDPPEDVLVEDLFGSRMVSLGCLLLGSKKGLDNLRSDPFPFLVFGLSSAGLVVQLLARLAVLLSMARRAFGSLGLRGSLLSIFCFQWSTLAGSIVRDGWSHPSMVHAVQIDAPVGRKHRRGIRELVGRPVVVVLYRVVGCNVVRRWWRPRVLHPEGRRLWPERQQLQRWMGEVSRWLDEAVRENSHAGERLLLEMLREGRVGITL
mmetsp:Transcript_13207/g.31070  ORF Transcript_13207/g.31070 Transcript_13207/m.31070 type:complete len:267 (+) Transcript_13207:104-904(+)